MTDHQELDWILTVCVTTPCGRCGLSAVHVVCRRLDLAIENVPRLQFSQPQPHLAGMYKVRPMRCVSEIFGERCLAG